MAAIDEFFATDSWMSTPIAFFVDEGVESVSSRARGMRPLPEGSRKLAELSAEPAKNAAPFERIKTPGAGY